MAMAFSIAAEIECDLISARTKEALKARKAADVKLGRPKESKKLELDDFREKIVATLKNGSTITYVFDIKSGKKKRQSKTEPDPLISPGREKDRLNQDCL